MNPEIFGREEASPEVDRGGPIDEATGLVLPKSVVARNAKEVAGTEYICRFRGRPMVLDYKPFPHFVPLHKERFEKIAYPILGGVTRSRMTDVFAYLSSTAEDLTENEHYILFGVPDDLMEVEATTDIVFNHKNPPTVWDMDELTITQSVIPAQCIWRSPYRKVVPPKDADGKRKPIPFIMQLAGNDQGLYDDIMQSLAPLVMKKKPDGVVWWVGDGANGKSTLMDAIYRIFPGQLSSITVKRLVDGRDTPSLNGTLANIVKESSEGRVEDTEIYKAIGTHENFRVHKFHSQDDVEIQGNLHHIFSANMIPSFNDKGYAARRRTFIIPFTQRFESNPSFEEETFTEELFGQLILEMCSYANRIKRQGYRYKWSAKTLAAKANYDAEASNAEEYTKEFIAQGVVAFDSYSQVKMDYDNWCADNGYVPLGITNLRRALQAVGFDRVTKREGNDFAKVYRLASAGKIETQAMGMGRPGLYTAIGWAEEAKDIVDRAEAKKAEEEKPPEQTSILNGKW